MALFQSHVTQTSLLTHGWLARLDEAELGRSRVLANPSSCADPFKSTIDAITVLVHTEADTLNERLQIVRHLAICWLGTVWATYHLLTEVQNLSTAAKSSILPHCQEIGISCIPS